MTIRENLKAKAVKLFVAHEIARKKLQRTTRKLTDAEYQEVAT